MTHLRSYVGVFFKDAGSEIRYNAEWVDNLERTWKKKEFLPEEDHVNPVKSRSVTFRIKVRGLL